MLVKTWRAADPTIDIIDDVAPYSFDEHTKLHWMIKVGEDCLHLPWMMERQTTGILNFSARKICSTWVKQRNLHHI